MSKNTQIEPRLIRKRCLFAACCLWLAAGSGEDASAFVLTKYSGGDWFIPQSWSPGQIPTLDDDAILTSGAEIADNSAATRTIRLDSTLTMGDGGNLSVGFFVWVGSTLQSGGTFNVEGEDSSVGIGRSLIIGNASTGEMNVTSGNVAARGISVGGGGLAPEVVSEISRLRTENPNYVPSRAIGKLSIRGGAATVSSSTIGVGGTTGFNSFGDITQLQAEGELTISEGGRLFTPGESNNRTAANILPLGTATVTDTGSAWTLHQDLVVSGALSIKNGGLVELQQPAVVRLIPIGADDKGTLTVDGADSSLRGEIELILDSGNAHGGNLSITRGGHVHSANGSIKPFATALVSGPGSWWQIDQKLTLSMNLAAGSALTIENGGKVTVGDLNLGSSAGNHGQTGVLRVLGAGSRLDIARDTEIGRGNGGLMHVGDGGHVSGAKAAIGQGIAGFPGSGQVLVDGGGTNWSVAESLTIGTKGGGVLSVANQGAVSAQVMYLGGPIIPRVSPVPSGTLNIGAASGLPPVGAGVLSISDDVNIDQTGVIVFNHTDNAHEFTPRVESVAFGMGAIEQRAGTTILNTDLNRYTGTTRVLGGTLIVNNALGSPIVHVASGATLGGSGTLNTVVAEEGAIISAGNSPGILTINGDLDAEGATLVFEITGDEFGADYDVINVSGNANLVGSLLQLVFTSGFAPSAGQQFNLLNTSGLVSGAPMMQVLGLEDGWLFDAALDITTNTFSVHSRNSGVSVAPIPIPATLALFCWPLLWLTWRTRASTLAES